MDLPTRVETAIVGAGQAGLSTSWLLARAGREHVLLERRATLGGGWLDRWESFCLVSPNWTASFPGFGYHGPDADGFMPRDAIAGRVAGYAASMGAPVVLEAGVRRLSRRADGGFRLETERGELHADRVIVAVGSFHRPRRPPIAAALPARLVQLHTHEYRSEAGLPPGAVLVVGSGQSGVQIAEELAEAGRAVYLSAGRAGRVPRRYRGSDCFRWLVELAHHGERLGVGLPTVGQLADPLMKYAGNPALSGHGGGHDMNLREFAARGMTLLGRIAAADGERLALAPDLAATLAFADGFFDERFRSLIDRYIELAGIDAPPDDRTPIAFQPAPLESIDLGRAGISTVIWATGYGLDYGWIDLPLFDERGYPRQSRGLTELPGLAFVGLLWAHNQLSATLPGAGLEARHVVAALGVPVPDPEELFGGPMPIPA